MYDSSGNVIAYNDDSFQDTDSTIIDLTLPTTGTYYVEVTSSPNNRASRADQTGAYELFMYTFATGSDPPAGYGDSLYAGSGDDTIIAGSADDSIAARSRTTRSSTARARVTQLSKRPVPGRYGRAQPDGRSRGQRQPDRRRSSTLTTPTRTRYDWHGHERRAAR